MTADEGSQRASAMPPPVPADVGIVAALAIEVHPFLGKLKRVRTYAGPRHKVIEGELGDKLIALVIAGPGRVAARRGAELLLAGHRPRWLVSAGIAGALDLALERNAIVVPHEVIDSDNRLLAIDVGLDVTDPTPHLRNGRILTVDAIARTAAEKASLRERFGADLVDMETAAVAALCAERQVRFIAVRVISDDAKADLPREILTIMGPSGGFRWGATVGALWKRPSSIMDLLTLREHAHEAADRLAMILPALIARLT